EELLNKNDLRKVPKFPVDKVDFGWVIPYKTALLEKAFNNFKASTDTALRADFISFTQQNADWLDDYALFRSLKDVHGGVAWNKWKPKYALRDAATLEEARENMRNHIEAQRFFQFLFFKQWFELKKYSNEKGIKIIGDVPIFIAYDSADVWTNPH